MQMGQQCSQGNAWSLHLRAVVSGFRLPHPTPACPSSCRLQADIHMFDRLVGPVTGILGEQMCLGGR